MVNKAFYSNQKFELLVILATNYPLPHITLAFLDNKMKQ